MKRAVFSALLVCCLGVACGSNNHDPGNQPASMAGSAAGPSAGSSGAAGQPGGQSAGGKANDNGGSVNGGAGAHAGTSSGGSGNAAAGGQTQWPDWVDSCLAFQAERCSGTRDELVCIYGTDKELASTMVSCNDTVRDYKDYCKCNVGGCGRSCRPEYQ